MPLSLLTPPRVAVVGGGMAGLTCARVLLRHGVRVLVVDKARKPGGRLSTRRTDDGLAFDHGAQYFTIRSPWFRRTLKPWIEDGTVAPWSGRVVVVDAGGQRPSNEDHERWVGVPSMSALPRALAKGLELRTGTRVTALLRVDGRWSLAHEGDASPDPALEGFDGVVLAIPSAQAAALLDELPALQSVANAATMHPCWALMLYAPGTSHTTYDGAFVHDSPLSWAMREPSKPGRPPQESWVLHATATWSHAHWDDDPLALTEALLEAWHARGGPSPRVVSQTLAHRWRYASVDASAEPRAAGDDEAGVALAGDWLGGGRVEGAFLSGRRAAAGVLASLRRARAATSP